MTLRIAGAVVGAFVALSVAVPAHSADFPFRRNVTLKVGQSVVLKGVRPSDCGNTPPSWSRIAGRMPRSKLGTFSDGGAGTVRSNACKGRVAARGVRFTAKKQGTETFVVFDDRIRVRVN